MDRKSISNMVNELTRSYNFQVELYNKLLDKVQKLYSRLVLSRGDLSQVGELFEQKKQLLESITQERRRIQPIAEQWRECKNSIEVKKESGRLDSVLQQTQDSIRLFLDAEQQLEQYLKHLKGSKNSV